MLTRSKLFRPRALPGARQLPSGGIGLTKITTLALVESAILKIKEQGEGPDQSPFSDFPGELAHYYKFGEIHHGQTFIQGADGKWDYKGSPVPFPDVFPMSRARRGVPRISRLRHPLQRDAEGSAKRLGQRKSGHAELRNQ